MSCDGLHAWCLTQSRLTTLIPSLIPCQLVGSYLMKVAIRKNVSVNWLAPEALSLLGPPGVQLVSFLCSFSVLVLLLSPQLNV